MLKWTTTTFITQLTWDGLRCLEQRKMRKIMRRKHVTMRPRPAIIFTCWLDNPYVAKNSWKSYFPCKSTNFIQIFLAWSTRTSSLTIQGARVLLVSWCWETRLSYSVLNLWISSLMMIWWCYNTTQPTAALLLLCCGSSYIHPNNSSITQQHFLFTTPHCCCCCCINTDTALRWMLPNLQCGE